MGRIIRRHYEHSLVFGVSRGAHSRAMGISDVGVEPVYIQKLLYSNAESDGVVCSQTVEHVAYIKRGENQINAFLKIIRLLTRICG